MYVKYGQNAFQSHKWIFEAITYHLSIISRVPFRVRNDLQWILFIKKPYWCFWRKKIGRASKIFSINNVRFAEKIIHLSGKDQKGFVDGISAILNKNSLFRDSFGNRKSSYVHHWIWFTKTLHLVTHSTIFGMIFLSKKWQIGRNSTISSSSSSSLNFASGLYSHFSIRWIFRKLEFWCRFGVCNEKLYATPARKKMEKITSLCCT